MSNNVMPPILTDHACCYADCPEPGTIHIGPDGGASHWICWRHLDRWNQARARFLADGGGCEMEELGELLTPAPTARAVPRDSVVGRLRLRTHITTTIQKCSRSFPCLRQRKRRLREVNLARVMLVMVDIVLAGDPLGLETARDLVREVRHTYPELLDENL